MTESKDERRIKCKERRQGNIRFQQNPYNIYIPRGSSYMDTFYFLFWPICFLTFSSDFYFY